MAIKDYIYIYSIEMDDGLEQFYTDKTQADEEAVKLSKPVHVHGYSRDDVEKILVKYLTSLSRRSRAGRASQKIWAEKYATKEERSKIARNGGIARAKQRWNNKETA